MNEQVREYIKKYPIEIIDMYNALRKLILIVLRQNHKKRCGLKFQVIMLGNLL